jgi:hypothetical protein
MYLNDFPPVLWPAELDPISARLGNSRVEFDDSMGVFMQYPYPNGLSDTAFLGRAGACRDIVLIH